MNALRALEIRLAVAEEMVRYFGQADQLVGPEVDALDVLLPVGPVGFVLPEGYPERALMPTTPHEYWMDEHSAVRKMLGLLTMPTELLPVRTQTEGPILLPAPAQQPIVEAV